MPSGVTARGSVVQRQYALVPSPPEDLPTKRYLLYGPNQNLDYATFKKVEALNGVLILRMAERKLIEQAREEVRQKTMWAEAARRLPL